MVNIKLFDPMTMDSNTLPNVAGNYVYAKEVIYLK